MRKGVQIAFGITLVVLAAISTICNNTVLESIIYAVVIPSFILSIISFVSDVATGCEQQSETKYEYTHKISELTHRLADLELQQYELGIGTTTYVEGVVPKEVYEKNVEGNDYLKQSLEYARTQIFFLHAKIICDRISIIGYTMLFLSLCLSPIIAKWLSVVNLNCITLWSLAVLYITLELKSEICDWVFKTLHKINKKRLGIDKLLSNTPSEEEP